MGEALGVIKLGSSAKKARLDRELKSVGEGVPAEGPFQKTEGNNASLQARDSAKEKLGVQSIQLQRKQKSKKPSPIAVRVRP